MWVHWKKKQLRVPHKGKRVMLHGVKEDMSSCTQTSGHKLKGLLKHKAVLQCVGLLHVTPLFREELGLSIYAMEFSEVVPTAIQEVVQDFQGLFQ
jgi:hypothetical protein